MSGRIYHFFTRKEQPRWIWDLALELRIPALFFCYSAYKNTKLYLDALTYCEPNSTWGVAKGKLLNIQKHNFRYIGVPRYTVQYEFEISGVRYTSTRGTTGSPYRDWMNRLYRDTITESEYLQAIPVLREGENCTIFYNKQNPSISALAHDANSFELSILAFLGVFPILFGSMLKTHFWMIRKAYFPRKKMRVKFLSYSDNSTHANPPLFSSLK